MAETRGAVRFAECDGSDRWWLACRIKLRALAKDRSASVERMRAFAAFAELASGQVTATSGLDRAREALTRVERLTAPWIMEGSTTGGLQDTVARWYLLNMPDRMRELGVEFAESTAN